MRKLRASENSSSLGKIIQNTVVGVRRIIVSKYSKWSRKTDFLKWSEIEKLLNDLHGLTSFTNFLSPFSPYGKSQSLAHEDEY